MRIIETKLWIVSRFCR